MESFLIVETDLHNTSSLYNIKVADENLQICTQIFSSNYNFQFFHKPLCFQKRAS